MPNHPAVRRVVVAVADEGPERLTVRERKWGWKGHWTGEKGRFSPPPAKKECLMSLSHKPGSVSDIVQKSHIIAITDSYLCVLRQLSSSS